MPAAVGGPDRLELLDDPVDAVGQQPGKRQESERTELVHLVFRKGFLGMHDSLLSEMFRAVSSLVEPFYQVIAVGLGMGI